MPWDVEYPIDFSESGDTTSQAIDKLIKETDRIYDLLNRLRTADASETPPENPDPYQLWLDVSGRIEGEEIGEGDDYNTVFNLQYYPVKANSETIYLDEEAQTRDTDYTIDYDAGEITFFTPPASGVSITADYTPENGQWHLKAWNADEEKWIIIGEENVD